MRRIPGIGRDTLSKDQKKNVFRNLLEKHFFSGRLIIISRHLKTDFVPKKRYFRYLQIKTLITAQVSNKMFWTRIFLVAISTSDITQEAYEYWMEYGILSFIVVSDSDTRIFQQMLKDTGINNVPFFSKIKRTIVLQGSQHMSTPLYHPKEFTNLNKI